MLFSTSAFSPADLPDSWVVQVFFNRRGLGAGTMRGLTLTLQTLGSFLQSGRVPGHPPNHMVKKTTRLSKDRNILQTKGEVFVWIWVGGFNYWTCMNEEVKNNPPKVAALYCTQEKSWCFSTTVQDSINVGINAICLDYVESAAVS